MRIDSKRDVKKIVESADIAKNMYLYNWMSVMIGGFPIPVSGVMASMIYEMGVKSLTDINVDKPFYTALFIVGGLATAGVIAYSVIKGQLAKRYYNRNIKDKLIQNEDVFKTDALRPL